MRTTENDLSELRASDLMTPDVVRLPEKLPLRDAVRLMIQNQVDAAPVVDAWGRCVGLFSATDFLRLALRCDDVTWPVEPARPVSCAFLRQRLSLDGKETALCTLPAGVCPVQVQKHRPDGTAELVCSQPHCVLSDWQVVEVEKLPSTELHQFMSGDPVTVAPTTPLRALARVMIDTRAHSLVVTDDKKQPIGMLSATDLLAVLARRDEDETRADPLC